MISILTSDDYKLRSIEFYESNSVPDFSSSSNNP